MNQSRKHISISYEFKMDTRTQGKKEQSQWKYNKDREHTDEAGLLHYNQEEPKERDRGDGQTKEMERW